VHVSQVILSFDIVLVVLDQLVFVGKFEDDREEAKELNHHFRVTFPAEVLDFFDVVLQNGRLSALMVSIKLGEVVDLDVVHDRLSQSEWSVRLSRGSLK